MCTYLTHRTELTGSGRFEDDWLRLARAVVYYDHPQDAPLTHALCIDFRPAEARPGQRLAVELDAGSARRLAETILAVLADDQVRDLEPEIPAGAI